MQIYIYHKNKKKKKIVFKWYDILKVKNNLNH